MRLCCAAEQVTIDLPDGRTIQLPVGQATHGADVASHVASLLSCERDDLRLWPAGKPMLADIHQVCPGTYFRAKLRSSGPGKWRFRQV